MGRRLLLALVAAGAMFAAVATVFLASLLLPPSIIVDLPGDTKDLKPALDQQEKARLARRLQEGYVYRRNGDYDRAIAAFGEVANARPEWADIREAQFRLGQTYLLDKNLPMGMATLQKFSATYGQDPQVAFMLGLAYREMRQWDKAIASFGEYSSQASTMDPYARFQLGLTYRDSGNLSQAIVEFEKALSGKGPRLFEIEAMERIAEAQVKLKNYDGAVGSYDKIRARAATDPYRAELSYRAAIAHRAAGRLQEATGLLLNNVASYPSAGYALLALDELNKMDPSLVGYYQEGLVYYLNGAYDKAIASFGQLLVSQPQNRNAADALYFQGMAFQKQGNQAQAIVKFDQLMRSYPNSARVGAAWFQKAESQARARSHAEALVTYRQFAAALPQHELAQEARWETAQLLEALRRPEEARKEYVALQQAYPTGKHAEEALFRQGLVYFKQGQFDRAAQVWDSYLKAYTSAAQRARGSYWLGKSYQMSGNSAEAIKYLQHAAQATPDEYYGLRAKAVTRPMTATLSIQRVEQNLVASDTENERKEAVDWLGRWVSPPPTISILSAITTTITQDPGFSRGEELLKVGLRQEAIEEFKEVAARFRSDAIGQLQLAMFFRDRELYQLSIGAAARAASLSGERSYLSLPRLLIKLLYPPYYADLALAEAEKGGFDPLLLLSLIRQESAFEKHALSSAQARGLTQVIPSTGQWLATKLGISSFSPESLDRPYLSIRFGATYLGGLLSQFDNNQFFAIAGYNGGPGNVGRWSNGDAKYDVDLFTEDIDYSETKLYVKLVSQNYEMYKMIYG